MILKPDVVCTLQSNSVTSD